MSDTTLNLGSFQFQGMEIPAQITGVGAKQSLAVRKFVGGDREIHAMGQDYAPLEWSGLFFGSDALDRMNALKALVISGLPQILLWHTFNYLVLIRDFSADEELKFKIPYRISCEVVSDNTNRVASSVSATTDSAMAQGLSLAQLAAAVINDSTLNAQMAALAAVMETIETYVSIAASTVGLVLSAIQNVQKTVSSLIGIAESTISGPAGFAGVVVGLDALTMALSLDAVQSAALEESELWDLAGILGVMAANLNSVTGSPNTLVTAGGNLFQIAADEYGDAEDWTVIANANGLVDPFIQGAVTLNIPLSPGNSGGILSS